MKQVLFPLLILGAGLVGVYFLFHPETETSDCSERLSKAIEEAKKLGNLFVSARPNIAANGSRKSEATYGTLEIPFSPDYDVDDLFKRLINNSATTTVVYVHGYNVDEAEAIKQGNSLSKLMRENKSTDGVSIQFLTFLWRGNFGPEQYKTSIQSANSSAPDLFWLITNIANNFNRGIDIKRSIIIVAHSLGARVVLESLQYFSNDHYTPEIDVVLLLQPAVEWSSVYKGKYTILTKAEPVWKFTINEKDGTPYFPHEGKYYGKLRHVKRVIATMSSADNVLEHGFLLIEGRHSPYDMFVPPLHSPALGIPNKLLKDELLNEIGKNWSHSQNLELLDMSPRSGEFSLPVIRSHSDVFGNKLAVNYLWEKILKNTSTADRKE